MGDIASQSALRRSIEERAYALNRRIIRAECAGYRKGREDKVRLRNIPQAQGAVDASVYVVHTDELLSCAGRWRERFGLKDAGLSIEIGMGKGRFIQQLAETNPDTCYVGIERYTSVLYRALQLRKRREAEGENIRNLLYLCQDAAKITEIFGEGEVNTIYLNFSDPWPKDRHSHRRLPGSVFLERYRKILSPDGHLEFKTDNRALFDFAAEEAKTAGWTIEQITYDLHHDPVMNAGNIMTEYEERFSAKGNPIFKLIERP